jgi:hypothetical protein
MNQMHLKETHSKDSASIQRLIEVTEEMLNIAP